MSADLLYSDTEEDLRASVRRLLVDRCPPELVLTAYDSASADFSAVWTALAVELGLAGLLVPESLGGAGASTREAAVVMEELGRAAAPSPYLSSAVLATVALRTAGETQTLGALAAGQSTGTLTVPLSTGPQEFVGSVRLAEAGLVGRVSSVAGAAEADVLVVPVVGADGLELHTVPRAADGVRFTPVLSLDMTRPLADVEFSGAASTRVDNGNADAAVREALLCAAVLLSSEQLGVAQWCLETTLAYVKDRKQSGARSAPTRPSSIVSRTSGSSARRPRRRPGTRRTPTPAGIRMRRLPPRWRRPIAATWPYTRPRSAFSCTGGSA